MVATHGGHAHGSAEPGMNAASAANSEPDATTNTNDAFKPFRLFDLPVEVQDMIFDLAYPPIPNLTLISKKRWDDCEYHEQMKDSSYQLRPLPSNLTVDMLVSKAFFEAATGAWGRNQWFGGGHTYSFSTARGEPLGAEFGLLKYAQNLIFTDAYMATITGVWFQSLKKVKVHIEVDEFRHLHPRYPWTTLYKDEEIKEILAYKGVTRLRGLTSFEAEAVSKRAAFGSRDFTASEIQAFEANVARLEVLVKEQVMKPKKKEKKSSKRMTDGDDLTDDDLDKDSLVEDDLEEEIRVLRQEKEQMRKEVQDTRQELEDTRQELESTRQELESTRQELDSARQELEKARKMLATPSSASL